MAERLPKLTHVKRNDVAPYLVTLVFDQPLTYANSKELFELVSLQFAGQLRRDPNAPQTPPPQPGDEAAERSASTGER